jgi:hypothetical protein
VYVSLCRASERRAAMAKHKIFAEETVDMKNQVQDGLTALSDIRDIVKAWRKKLTEEMKGVWEGDDYDKFRSDFERDIEGFDKADEAMGRLLQSVDAARREYDQMESDIISLNIIRV